MCKVTGVAERVQTPIIALKHARRLHNRPDSGPDLRGRKRAFLRFGTAAIGAYLDDSKISLDDKGKPWQDIAEDGGLNCQRLHISSHRGSEQSMRKQSSTPAKSTKTS